MKKSGVVVVLVVLAVGIGLALLAKGCGGGPKPVASVRPAPPTPVPAVADPPPVSAIASALPLVAGQAILRGRVLFRGEVPERARMEVTKDPEACQCAPGDPSKKSPYKLDESLVVDAETKGINNAVVWIRGVRGGPERLEVVVDQRGCEFVPHVALITPGGHLNVLNPDQIAHNYHSFALQPGNPSENSTCPKHRKQLRFPTEGGFAKPEFVRATCDIHPWMGMWVAVVENGFCAVTDAQGRFSILGLAPGTYTAAVWHETLAKTPRAQEVTLGPDGAELEIQLAP